MYTTTNIFLLKGNYHSQTNIWLVCILLPIFFFTESKVFSNICSYVYYYLYFLLLKGNYLSSMYTTTYIFLQKGNYLSQIFTQYVYYYLYFLLQKGNYFPQIFVQYVYYYQYFLLLKGNYHSQTNTWLAFISYFSWRFQRSSTKVNDRWGGNVIFIKKLS